MDSNGPGGAPAPPRPSPATRFADTGVRKTVRPYNFFRRRADRFRQKIVEIGGILAIFVSGNHTLSLLETTHCPVWKAHIVLFGKHTMSCLESTHSLVWRTQILLFGEHTFSCLESTHSRVSKAHILLFGKHHTGYDGFPDTRIREAGGRGGREPPPVRCYPYGPLLSIRSVD